MTEMLEREVLDPVAEAEQELAEAEAEVRTYEQRVVDGDTTVTAAVLEHARGIVEMATLRLQGVRKRAAETAMALQAAEVEQLREDLAAFASPEQNADLQNAYADTVRALAELHRCVDERHQVRAALVGRASELGVPQGRLPQVTAQSALEFALVEARTGLPPKVEGSALPHPLLHTAERAAELHEQAERRRTNVERVQAERVAASGSGTRSAPAPQRPVARRG